MKHKYKLAVGLALAATLAVACSGRSKDKDGGQDAETADSTVPLPDGYGPLWPCDNVGMSCNAHDSCAIDPICGPDNKCYPSALQQCADELDCTEDHCMGMGLCDNVPKEGYCALPIKVGGGDAGVAQTEIQCFKKGERDPSDACRLCEPEEADRKWTAANGGACNDGNDCTKDDYCQAGECKGVYYGTECADGYSCTEDLCDGAGKCLGHQLKPDHCLISGVCYKDGANHPQGSCFTCDVSKSQQQWTPITDSCLIDSACYKSGDKHTGGCAECAPAVSTTAWTIVGDNCLINNTCYTPQTKDVTGCAECDPTSSKTAWTPLAGLCKIDNACHAQGDKHPGGCAECDPAASTTAWTVVGSTCLINNLCKNPGDKDTTGCNECDPAKSKTSWSTVANTCFINGKCYTTGTKDPTGCAECNPAISSTSWTVTGSNCLIAGACYTPAQADPTACATCDPTKSKTAWTPDAGKCLIAGTCYADGDKDTTGCLQCSGTVNPTGWSPVTGAAVTTYTFESGTAPGWIITNSAPSVGWVVSTKRPGSGSYSLYYGDPSTGTYSTGAANSGTAITPVVSLAAGMKAGLTFLLYMDTEGGSIFDALTVYVNGASVWVKDTTTVPTMKVWQTVTVDLSAYAGQSILIKFEFDTVDSLYNSTEGLYLDDVTIYNNC